MAISNKTRENLVVALAEHITDAADMNTVVQFFYEHQEKYLDDLSEDELLDMADLYGIEIN